MAHPERVAKPAMSTMYGMMVFMGTPSITDCWWARLGSNQRPLPCHGSALPSELRARETRPAAGPRRPPATGRGDQPPSRSGSVPSLRTERVCLVPPAGIEPATVGLRVRCCFHLSYGGVYVEATLGFEPSHAGLQPTAGTRPDVAMDGAADRARTDYLLHGKQVLYQMSYSRMVFSLSPAIERGESDA